MLAALEHVRSPLTASTGVEEASGVLSPDASELFWAIFFEILALT